MRKYYVLLAAALVTTVGVRMMQAQTLSYVDDGMRFKSVVERIDPGLDAIVSADAQMAVVKNGFVATEGLTWLQDGPTGHLYFCDRSVDVNVVYKMAANGKTEVAVKDAGYRGPRDAKSMQDIGHLHTNGFDAKDPHYQQWISSGCDGLGADPQGRLLIATFGGRTIERLEKDGKRTVLAERFDGKKFNGTDDIVVRRNGTIYFTDIYDFRTNAKSPLVELHQVGLYMIKDGKVTLALSQEQNPGSNGVALSPDEKYLYVTTSGKKLSRYEVQPDDTLINGKLFADLSADPKPGSPDGLRADSQGNVYCSGPGGLWIFSPAGKHLGTIKVPENFASFGFGDADYKTMYIGGESTIYMIQMNVAGIHF
jgi:gluconolactonase